MSSWILAGFVSTAPQWELLNYFSIHLFLLVCGENNMRSCFLFSFLENFFLLWLIFNMISILLAKNSVHSTVLLPIITIFFFFFYFLQLHLWHMEIPGLEVKSELQLQAYTIAMATLDPSHICDLCHSLQQHLILNPLSEVRDRTHVPMETMSGS